VPLKGSNNVLVSKEFEPNPAKLSFRADLPSELIDHLIADHFIREGNFQLASVFSKVRGGFIFHWALQGH
jgi:hypothetical protein